MQFEYKCNRGNRYTVDINEDYLDNPSVDNLVVYDEVGFEITSELHNKVFNEIKYAVDVMCMTEQDCME